MSMTKKIRPVDANNLARRIREYMADFPNATTRLATCRVILSMLGDETQTPTLRPVTRDQVEKVWRGEWVGMTDDYGCTWHECSRCEYGLDSLEDPNHFCPNCGAPMTDEAVEMVMERVEALHAEN